MCSALNGFSTRGCPGILNLTSPGLPVMKRTGIGRSEQIDWTAVIPQPGLNWIDDPQRLTLETRVDGTETNSDVSVSMGLIVTELVINAIKHAFPDQAAGGRITVSFAADGGAWLLSVADNGAGMPVGEDHGKPGLGTGIVEALSRQLEASVTVVDANPGTRVEIRHDQGRGDNPTAGP